MTKIFFLYPVHLFSKTKNLEENDVYLIEDPRFFTEFEYHSLKIAYHRASMKSYYDFLKKSSKNIKSITYIDYKDVPNFYKTVDSSKASITTYNPCDNILEKKLVSLFPDILVLDTHNFTVSPMLLDKNRPKFYKKNNYNFMNFYKWQRTRLDILMNEDGTPKGGQWSFDKDNREKLPASVKIPSPPSPITNKYITEAKKYVSDNFPTNYGSLDNFIYPIDHKSAKKWLQNFIKTKFKDFGIYEDAETERDPFLFHSVLTPMMNIGLLTDWEVLDEVLEHQDKIPLNSMEGFIRQVIGWRNYIYTVYYFEGDKMKTMNFMNHHHKINRKIMWEGKTEIQPIDYIINKIDNYAYAHHIERLMYLGNFLFICQINPNDVYNLFMEWTIDAYEWVMVPNVYSMSQFADGGLMMTRPYFSSSNYILSMSDYKKAPWCKTWDAIYYNFIKEHREYLIRNYATARQVKHWDNKTKAEQKELINNAETYLEKIYIK